MIEVYSKDACPQCVQAVNMLNAKGLEYKVLKLGVDYTRDELLVKAPGARTVPQVFADGVLVGDLAALNRYLASV